MFGKLLSYLRRGRTEEELGRAMERVIDLAKRTGNPGSVTLKINVTPKESENGGGAPATVMLEFNEKITIAEPQPKRAGTVMFVGEKGNLLFNDPRQKTLDQLRRVEAGEVIKAVLDTAAGGRAKLEADVAAGGGEIVG